MPLGKDYERQDCSLARALEEVGERWTLLVLRDCLFGVRRFSDLRARLEIPRAVLADRLSSLVAGGLLERRPYRADRVEYLPTEKAVALWPAMHALVEWGERYHGAPGGRRRIFRHTRCGVDLDEGRRCPACGELPPVEELEFRAGPGLNPAMRTDPVSVALRDPHRMLEPVRSD